MPYINGWTDLEDLAVAPCPFQAGVPAAEREWCITIGDIGYAPRFRTRSEQLELTRRAQVQRHRRGRGEVHLRLGGARAATAHAPRPRHGRAEERARVVSVDMATRVQRGWDALDAQSLAP